MKLVKPGFVQKRKKKTKTKTKQTLMRILFNNYFVFLMFSTLLPAIKESVQ